MSIQIAIHHKTTYDYEKFISLGPQTIRLRPAPHCRTPILGYSLKIEPENHFLNWQQDPHGNFLARLVFPEKTKRFSISVDVLADMAVINPFDFFLDPEAEKAPFEYDPLLSEELKPFRHTQPLTPRLAKWVESVDRTPIATVDFLVGLNQRLANEIDYVIRMEPGVQTPEQTLTLAKGSCRDTAWLLTQILRHLGFAARFVSGYLVQLVADEKPVTGPAGTSVDFTDLHAWTEVFLPGAGWVGLDPTSGLFAGEGHIPLAATPEPGSAAPVTGKVEKSEVTFGFDMTIKRFSETPRVTKPYDDASWAKIEALGHDIDRRIAAADMRLTMGGEPTFISASDMDSDEWNTTALGPTKRKLAGRLMQRLAARFARGHLLHFGQGKWYPGEQLPRWALSCHWRRDGEPIWRNPALLASDDDADKTRNTSAEAGRFIAALAERLQVNTAFCMPGFEDAWYYMWRERRLPTNVDPLRSNLADPEERIRLSRIFEQGLGNPVGYALPLQRRSGANGSYWESGAWFLRPQNLYLIPGDSPMGYRLPLDSLPWVAANEYPYHWTEDPMQDRPELPPLQAFRRVGNTVQMKRPPALSAAGLDERSRVPRLPPDQRKPQPHESAPWIVRSALCVEPRDGLLCIFMPPVNLTEDYLDLIAAVEDTAEQLGQKVVIEGYAPPSDPRLQHFSITPDPGVIEVNIHPSAGWDQLVDRTTILYEEARNLGLGTEKFMIDGRHVGTGGGNHVVIGAATPSDSPFLRRPDLLKSLVGFWQHHPSLSYLFSGLFIGPTSQHPRIDEARDDSIHELEIAFAELERHNNPPPWLVDRIFRNLLVDLTGNTHRAEFCIDKMFSPEGTAGRLGLLELRAFEMPPHARMSLTQQLLLRSILLRFWEKPYTHKPIRWGTRLHDEFMLPHFIWQDFTDVIENLNDAGLPIEAGWFAPHMEFRFPQIGQIAARGIELELRHALEPWHVLGEQGAAGGTVRYVDSSLERVQVGVRGFVQGRYIISCNGTPVPLRATGVQGEYVAGVRFRAWPSPESLHPTIPVHTPLVFDIYDSWSGRSVGGCTYHVAHPGGRNYDRRPVNANEAEARRRARFFPFGHTPGSMSVPAPTILTDMPVTLDLRHQT